MASIYSSTSPYFRTPIAVDYLDVMTYRDITAESDDIQFEVTAVYQNRPDLLAYDLYGDVNLWWVFSMRNQSLLKDPVYDLVPGLKIYLPKFSTLKKTLGI
jgi:hypothetical protein